jgi:4-hydroxybenzoate polyprenyltransferase
MTTSPHDFSLGSWLRLTRFWNLVIIAFSQYFAAFILIDPKTIVDWRLFVLSASTVLIAAGGYVINDYYDVKIDLINKPERVVIGIGVTRRYALLFHTVLSMTGFVLGLFLGWKIAAVNLMSAFLLWWYSNDLKRQPFIGNLVVAFLTGFSIEIINLLFRIDNAFVTIYALFAFYMTLIREIVKDMEDLKGDNTFGCRTLPIVWGLRKTKIAIYGITLTFLASVLSINYFQTGMPMLYFAFFLFVPLAGFTYRLVRADTTRDFHILSTFCKAVMLLGILSMAFVLPRDY